MSRPRFSLTLLLFFLCPSQSYSQSPHVMEAGELALALKKLNVLGSALYVAAHPDDENTAVLATLARGRLIRTAYLSVTRGEGGQNLIGAEQGALMGIIRTQELLAARHIDGAEQLFTRALDFGYSKSSEETIRIWEKDKALSDVVWAIRSFRPDVVITRFTPTQGGHGNHTGSALLAQEAFLAAGDPEKFPEQLRYVEVWKPRRLVWNVFRFQQSAAPVPPGALTLDAGGYTSLLGKSFTEIAGISRSMHKSQGFGAAENRGSFINYFQHTLGDSASHDLFEGVNLTWSRVRGGEKVARLFDEADRVFNPNSPARILPILIQAYRELSSMEDRTWAGVKKRELVEVIRSCAGLWIDALTSDFSASPGTDLTVLVTMLNRSEAPFFVESVSLPLGQKDTVFQALLEANRSIQARFPFRVPADAGFTQPYWLKRKPFKGSYAVNDQLLIGRPQNDPPFSARVRLKVFDQQLDLEVPFRFRWVDPVEGEQYRSFEIIPRVSVSLQEPVQLFPHRGSRNIMVNLRNGGGAVKGVVRLQVPSGWTVDPPSIPFDLSARGEERGETFRVQPSNGAANGTLSAFAEVDGKVITHGARTIHYPHIPPQTLFQTAEAKLLRIDLEKQGSTIAYIMGAGDDIPAGLRQMGYRVVLLSDEEIADAELSRFDAIVAGVRAYNTRPKLRAHQRRLMEYVEQGGTYVVQFVTLQRGESENLGPFPFTVSRDRVTVEEAPVTILKPDHPVLNQPNKITERDFNGWVQERGLYFAGAWDPQYETVIASNDPGEKSRQGGLLVARHGRGNFVYTGYAFFRQLPAGVPGAYRLFANILSLPKAGASH
ncbi:MAG: PIG-L family deacetylase [Bacteroidota bacterium]